MGTTLSLLLYQLVLGLAYELIGLGRLCVCEDSELRGRVDWLETFEVYLRKRVNLELLKALLEVL